jgi:uridylate kinase
LAKPKYKRVLLKLSGEALQGEREAGIDFEATLSLAKEISKVLGLGVEVAIVCGGGNLFRGRSGAKHGMDEATGDYIGMMATMMNALALQNALENLNIPTRVLTALETQRIAEPYIRRRALRHMEKGRVVICAGGTGSPFFTTDTAGVLRSIELKCDIMLKCSNVDGVFSADPKENPEAKQFKNISYEDVISKRLNALDMTAVSLAREKNLPIIVFDIFKPGNLQDAVSGESVGTRIGQSPVAKS